MDGTAISALRISVVYVNFVAAMVLFSLKNSQAVSAELVAVDLSRGVAFACLIHKSSNGLDSSFLLPFTLFLLAGVSPNWMANLRICPIAAF